MRAILKSSFLAAICVAEPAMETDFLAAHNAVRAGVGVPALKWSERLADQARGWANRLLVEKRLAHRSDSAYGQNLFEITGAAASPIQVVNAWDSEAADYDYAANKCRRVCGHYTQIVWASTKEVGCGVARDSRREVWVCDYAPPGNYSGKRPY
jgi:pathogenesis-related protein 1